MNQYEIELRDKVAEAIWDSLAGDTHTGLSFDSRTIQHSQAERMRKMATAAIKVMCQREKRDKELKE